MGVLHGGGHTADESRVRDAFARALRAAKLPSCAGYFERAGDLRSLGAVIT